MAAPKLEILSPDEHVSSQSDRLFIIGRTDAPVVDVYLNERLVSRQSVKDSVFHIPVQFGFGLNEIAVVPVSDESGSSAETGELVEVLYGPYPTDKFKRLYPLYRFHDSEIKEACLLCHVSTWENLEQVPDEAICLDCHGNLRDSFRRHTKAEDRACVGCHQLGSKMKQFGGADGHTNNPCFACHPERKHMFEQEYIHGPVAGGSCTICHNPHGSVYDHSLNQPPQILCLSCHEDLNEEQAKPVVHKPFKDGRCVACHDPHSTNNRWMLIKNSEKVCLECHNIQGTLAVHEHPFSVKPKKKLNVPLKLTRKGKLECVSCHNPHATQSEHLLRTTQQNTCVGCHSDML